MAQTKSIHDSTRHVSAEYKNTRVEMEHEMVVAKDGNGNIISPKPAQYLTAEQKKVFNKLKKVNSHLSINASENLSRLSMAIFELARNNLLIAETKPDEPEYQIYKKNIRDFDAMANYHEKVLKLTLDERYKAAAEATKLIIEQKKLAVMENQNKPQMMDKNLAGLVGLMGDES